MLGGMLGDIREHVRGHVMEVLWNCGWCSALDYSPAEHTVYVCALYVCLIRNQCVRRMCLPIIRAYRVCVCLICTPYAVYACLICLP